jgi:hypothetical protein
MLIFRQGLPNVRDHLEIWKNSLPDSKAVFEGAWPGEKLPDGKWRVMIRMHWIGTFLNDLPVQKASGTKVNFPMRVELIVRDDGLIEEAAEWYSTKFWDVPPVSGYHRRGNLPSTE